MTPCSGRVWSGWQYQPCRNPGLHLLGTAHYCRRCYVQEMLKQPPQPPADETELARTQLAARLAGRLAETMGWGAVRAEGGVVSLTAEQAAELVERLG